MSTHTTTTRPSRLNPATWPMPARVTYYVVDVTLTVLGVMWILERVGLA